ncbi:SRPBCC family protein [Luteolibacter flavescens]|uniref:SRPBCC family protein n=1 Tax=Luteolibacter flavescens TaxID=1859460 RepID=A0ABT3FMW5_9BACT|nr:SRPBCC family protein [Luteolibacter flavescens]MCW1884539.1 SRPBCC family protein [Luteolibacter flavescens]
MPTFSVHKSIRIAAPAQQVYDLIRDFKSWPAWSPWLLAEPGAKLAYSDDGRGYTWDGSITGSGEMEITGGDPPWSIHHRLTFLKPWKSVNQVAFHLSEHDHETDVEWTMEGSLPWFMWWMRPMMTAWIGSDYGRGLKMLKDLVETGTVPSRLDFPGIEEVKGFRYVGVRSTTPTAEISTSISRDMGKLMAWLEASRNTPSGPPFTITHKWDPVKGVADYTIGFPLTRDVQIPTDFVRGEIPSCRAYVVKHTGPYRHLGNAWAAGMMHGRAKKFTTDKKVPLFEIYDNDPTVTPEADLVTRVHLPAK